MLELPKIRQSRVVVFIFLGVFFFCSFAWGAESGIIGPHGSDQPIEITSQQLKADGRLNIVRFIGKVEARQGDVVLYAPELILYYAKGQKEIDRMEAPAGLRMVQGARTAKGDRGLYLAKEGKVILTGSARVTKGQSYLECDELIFFLNGEKSWCKSREGGQVKAVFFPKKEKE